MSKFPNKTRVQILKTPFTWPKTHSGANLHRMQIVNMNPALLRNLRAIFCTCSIYFFSTANSYGFNNFYFLHIQVHILLPITLCKSSGWRFTNVRKIKIIVRSNLSPKLRFTKVDLSCELRKSVRKFRATSGLP